MMRSRQAILDDPSLSPMVKGAMARFWRRVDELALEMECERLRKLAHEAPLNTYREDHDGHRWVELHSNAWADRSREWSAACAKLEAMRRAS